MVLLSLHSSFEDFINSLAVAVSLCSIKRVSNDECVQGCLMSVVSKAEIRSLGNVPGHCLFFFSQVCQLEAGNMI